MFKYFLLLVLANICLTLLAKGGPLTPKEATQTMLRLMPKQEGFLDELKILVKARDDHFTASVLICQGVTTEVKATSDWDSNDSNRRVLTSSSVKLRQEFSSPIHHLLLTLIYNRLSGEQIVVNQVRLDFLEPSTEVNVRLEASVSHKILVHGSHYARIIQ